MRFDLDEDQTMLRDSVRRYVEAEYDFERRRRMVEAGGFSRERWHAFAELGWLGVGLPDDVGGYGGAIESALVLEELGRALVLEPYLAGCAYAGQLLREKRVELLSRLVSGEVLYAVAHTEPAARGRLAWVETQARRSGDAWLLEGRKCLVHGGADADRFIVSARSAGCADDDEAGISLYLLARDTPGLKLRPYRLIDGSRAADLDLDGVELGGDALLGADGEAFDALQRATQHATVLCCAEMLGAMDRALWITRDYLTTRKQFGVAIGSFQSLQHRMADMYIALEQARSIVCRGLAFLDHADPVQRGAAVSAAKAQVGKCAQFVAAQAVQLHGGVGVTEEYSIGHYFKRLLVLEAAYGNTAFHIGRIAADLRAAA